MGMNNSDYGGGTPVSDVWRPDIGIAVGHLELVPKLVSIPVILKEGKDAAEVSVKYNYLEPQILQKNEELKTFEKLLLLFIRVIISIR
ncbi:MAG: hypothetical protein U5K00_16350 [Melioribacteraceae bacterium]|nr:hypothetical protein [Melioribacteraceae bacterium]